MSFAPPSGPPVGPFAPSPEPPRRGRRGGRDLRAADAPDWPWWAPFAAFFGALVAGQTVLIVLIVVASLFESGGSRDGDSDAPGGVLLAGNVVQDVLFVAFSAGVAWMVAGGVRREDFGLRMPAPRRALAALAITTVTYLVLSGIYLTLIGGGEEQDIPQELGADSSTLAAIGTVFLVCVCALIGEEVLFRGFLFRALIKPLRLWGAALVAGTLFGLVHVAGSPISVLPALAILGIGLCWLYWRTGSLLPGIALHLVNNAIALVTVLDWKAYWVPVILLCAGALVALAYRLVVRLDPAPAPAPV